MCGGNYIPIVETIHNILSCTQSVQGWIIFFMFDTDRFRIGECKIATIYLSDHSPVSMSLLLERKIRKTLWKLNSHKLNDPGILAKIKEDIKEYLELNTSEEVSPAILWDTLKAVMRGKIISITSHTTTTQHIQLDFTRRGTTVLEGGHQLSHSQRGKGQARMW